jgi:hypothetical protein
MASTVIRGAQIKDSTVQRHDLDTSTVGQAVVTKIVQGSGITLSSTGADSGTGDVTVSSPDVVSTDAGNIATLGTDNHILVPQSQIWSVRLRSFNSVGNPTFEVDQRNIGTALTNPANGTLIQDRWMVLKSALTGTVNTALQSVPTAPIVVPGTNFGITQAYQRFTVGTAQASLAAGDYYQIRQYVEGPRWRELATDVHSVSLLVRSSVAGLTLSISLQDAGFTHSLVKQFTISSANTWMLITLPNLPVWSGTFSAASGQAGYLFSIALAAGTTLTAAASSAWQAANVLAATGNSNFLATAGATLDTAFLQHEPGAQCTTPIDCPFTQNYDDCLRYYTKSYGYGVKAGAVDSNGIVGFPCAVGLNPLCIVPFKKTLAKIPSIIAYSQVTGAANVVRDSSGGVDRAVNSYSAVGDSGYGGCFLTTLNSGITNYQWQYTADTGW